jgi:hypothetical protein
MLSLWLSKATCVSGAKKDEHLEKRASTEKSVKNRKLIYLIQSKWNLIRKTLFHAKLLYMYVHVLSWRKWWTGESKWRIGISLLVLLLLAYVANLRQFSNWIGSKWNTNWVICANWKSISKSLLRVQIQGSCAGEQMVDFVTNHPWFRMEISREDLIFQSCIMCNVIYMFTLEFLLFSYRVLKISDTFRGTNILSNIIIKMFWLKRTNFIAKRAMLLHQYLFKSPKLPIKVYHDQKLWWFF